MTQKIIGKYLGEAVNDAIACLDHAEKGQPFTALSIFPKASNVTFQKGRSK
jgi:hypothetical protein